MPHYFLFDLDGTITESAPGIIKSVVHGLAAIGIHETDQEKLKTFIGPPLNVQMEKLYGLSDEEITKAIMAFREVYETKGILDCAPYPGIPALLKELHHKGVILGVASSKPEPFVKTILDHFQISSYFTVIHGSRVGDELDQLHKNKDQKAAIIQKAMNEFSEKDPQFEKSRALMIGDTAYDIKGAKDNHLYSIGVSYGYGKEEDLKKAGADEIAHSVSELRAILLSK